MKSIEINEFRGQVVGLDSVDIKNNLATHASGVNLQRRGEMLSMSGMDKWSTLGIGSQIDALHQLGDSNAPNDSLFMVAGGKVYKGPTFLDWDSSADATEPTATVVGFHWDENNALLYLAQANKIVRQSWDGSNRETYGSAGSGQDQFQNILSITMDEDGYLHILDNYTDWIKVKFGGDGWDKKDISAESFSYAIDIYYSSESGYFYITDYTTDEVVECDRDFSHDTRISYAGWESMVASCYSETGYNGSSRVGICQINDNYVVFTTTDTGTRNYVGAAWASHAGEIFTPFGIDFYGNYFYISDSGNDRIVRTIPNGSWWATYLSNGSGNKQCNQPKKIQIDSSGRLYFLDYLNKRIGRFDVENFN